MLTAAVLGGFGAVVFGKCQSLLLLDAALLVLDQFRGFADGNRLLIPFGLFFLFRLRAGLNLYCSLRKSYNNAYTHSSSGIYLQLRFGLSFFLQNAVTLFLAHILPNVWALILKPCYDELRPNRCFCCFCVIFTDRETDLPSQEQPACSHRHGDVLPSPRECVSPRPEHININNDQHTNVKMWNATSLIPICD
jgi:hypothetical protein